MSRRGLNLVDDHVSALREAVSTALASLTADLPRLSSELTTRLLRNDDLRIARERLFAVIAAAAMGGRPVQGLPVATISTLWWSGVDDDGLPNAALLTLHHISTIRASKERRTGWMEDVLKSTNSALEASIATKTRHAGEFSRQAVLSDHLGLHGGAYARDAAMTARICAPRTVEPWRRFGMLYGLLRRTTLDHRSSTVDEDGNPALIVPDLLMAHACARAAPAAKVELARLRSEASLHPYTRATLRDLLRSPHVVAAYRTDLRSLHHRAHAQLDELEPVSPYGELLRSTLDEALETGVPSAREVVGL